ncbi:MAG: hypothetical protein LPJ89_07550 [Hymenobacteraceae bacterium]|nr:hypothetical protein [Hymenobacteraceae bacterium]MDX5397691.1 hypothetical protein [Hymenobacteraceae bacterium]MDX5443621.1 hypothetical protein [Hymenobacteraceae bacterium]MDX5513769.1 hypothetical protein [Hymenobacteraceae bacterium]
MKKLILLLYICFFTVAAASAQSVEERAQGLTEEIAREVKLTKKEKEKLTQYNFIKLRKIDKLAKLREQDERYLNLRLDQIEEEYHAMVYNLLNKKKYLAYMKYKEKQPHTYAAVVKSKHMVATAEED